MNDEVQTKEEIEKEEEELRKEQDEFDKKMTVIEKVVEAGGVPTPEMDPRPFASLLRDERQLAQVFEHLQAVIWRSFAQDVAADPISFRKPTMAEVKRRFKICEVWFRRARGELGYSLEQTLDQMAHALRCALDGETFEPRPPGSRIWTPR